jgi:hypothetical protein
MTHLPAVVAVAAADFAVEVAACVPVVSRVACVLVLSAAVAAIAWPEELGLRIQ